MHGIGGARIRDIISALELEQKQSVPRSQNLGLLKMTLQPTELTNSR